MPIRKKQLLVQKLKRRRSSRLLACLLCLLVCLGVSSFFVEMEKNVSEDNSMSFAAKRVNRMKILIFNKNHSVFSYFSSLL